MDHKSFTAPLQSVYDLLEGMDITSTEQLSRLSEQEESEIVRALHEVMQPGTLEHVRKADIPKLSFYVDAPVTDTIARHGSLYASFAFYVTQALTTQPPTMEADPLARGEDVKVVEPNKNDWTKARQHYFPKYFVESLLKLKPTIERGMAVVVPNILDQSVILDQRTNLGWGVVKDRRTVEINLTRFKRLNPALYDETEPLAFVQLQLPALAGVPLETILDVRQREQRAFHRFTHHFYSMIKDHEGSLAREQDLIDAIKDVDDAVEELKAEFQRIRRELVFSNVEAGVSLTVCCLSLFLPLEYVAFLSALFGGKAGSTALRSFRNYGNDMSRLRNNECYIPWLIAHEHGKG